MFNPDTSFDNWDTKRKGGSHLKTVHTVYLRSNAGQATWLNVQSYDGKC